MWTTLLTRIGGRSSLVAAAIAMIIGAFVAHKVPSWLGFDRATSLSEQLLNKSGELADCQQQQTTWANNTAELVRAATEEARQKSEDAEALLRNEQGKARQVEERLKTLVRRRPSSDDGTVAPVLRDAVRGQLNNVEGGS